MAVQNELDSLGILVSIIRLGHIMIQVHEFVTKSRIADRFGTYGVELLEENEDTAGNSVIYGIGTKDGLKENISVTAA
jgi:hypothetical protein